MLAPDVVEITLPLRLQVRVAAGLALSVVHVNTVESRSATTDTFPLKDTFDGGTKHKYYNVTETPVQ